MIKKVKVIIIWLCILLCTFTRSSHAQPSIDTVWFNTDVVSVFEKYEVSCQVNTQVTDLFNYDKFLVQAIFTSPSGSYDTADGFYYQDYVMTEPNVLISQGDPFWKIRYTPDEAGTWLFHLTCWDSLGIFTSSTYSFQCVSSSNPGYYHFSEGYLIDDDGDIFIPVGENLAWGSSEGSFYEYELWADSLQANGINLAKIIMAPWSFGLEWENTGLGDYTNRQDRAWALDWVMEKLIERGIYISLVPAIHDELQDFAAPHKWGDCPYNMNNGGPCAQPWDFFTNPQAKDYFKRRIRYAISRYAYSPYLLLWEVFTETDNFDFYPDHKNDIRNWIVEMATYLKDDLNTQMQLSVGFAIPDHDSLTWQNNATDYTQLHLYEPSDQDLELKAYIKSRDYGQGFEKAAMVGELALFHINDTILKYDPNGIALHSSLWASLFSGSFCTALPWHWGYIHGQNLYKHFKPLAGFINAIDFSYPESQTFTVHTLSDSNLTLFVEPRFFSLDKKAPVDTFYVERNGNFKPGTGSIGEVLFGKGPVGQNLRNPPTFHTHYTQAGGFVVRTGSVVNNGILRIVLDGSEVFHEPVAPDMNYPISIPEGIHHIFAENTNTSFGSAIEIDQYQFYNYAPVIRSFALLGENNAIGWYQNRLYNWNYWYENQTHPPLARGTLVFDHLTGGNYTIEWWNCSNGTIDSVTQTSVSSGSYLELEINNLLWDGAFRIEPLVEIEEANKNPVPSILWVYPNPFINHTCIEVRTGYSEGGIVIIHDSRGAVVKEFQLDGQSQHPVKFFWVGSNELQKKLGSGLYFVTLKTNDFFVTKKIIKMGY